jgi:alginate O-acetyltransferase complex protein AlgI
MSTPDAICGTRIARILAWAGMVPGIFAAFVVLPADPAWLRMWGLAAVMAFFGKAITSTEPLAGVDHASIGRKAAYLCWPGMTPRQFFANGNIAAPLPGEWLEAAYKLATGVLMMVASVKIAAPLGVLIAGWIGMIGFVLALHFGLFHGLALVLRTAGIDARPIMNRPLLATSLSDFWGARWNRAFSEPAFRMLCRPMAKRLGLPLATMATFLASGLMHELVITVPARAAYGLPTLYFAVQGVAVLFERSAAGYAMGLGQGWRGRAFAIAITVLPAPILFPPVFVERVAVPFLNAITGN